MAKNPVVAVQPPWPKAILVGFALPAFVHDAGTKPVFGLRNTAVTAGSPWGMGPLLPATGGDL